MTASIFFALWFAIKFLYQRIEDNIYTDADISVYILIGRYWRKILTDQYTGGL